MRLRCAKATSHSAVVPFNIVRVKHVKPFPSPRELAELDVGSARAILERLAATPAEQSEAFEADPAVQTYLRETVVAEAEHLGLSGSHDAMGGFVVRAGSAGAHRALLFGYAMTHPANRMADPYVPSVSAGRLRGRGVAEQKGALAAALMATAWIHRRRSRLDGELVLCVSAAGETGRHDAARTFMAGHGSPPFDWAIVAIGTGNAICPTNKGRIDLTVVVRGRSAHSSTPWAGDNAIVGATEALRRLAAVDLGASHPALGSATLTPTAVESRPRATHTIPDEVRLIVDRRLLPGDDVGSALADVRAALEGMEPFSVSVEPGPFMFPSEVAERSAVVSVLQEAFTALTGAPAPIFHSHGALDAGFFNVEGVPAVMLGPGEPAMWHTDEETVDLEQVASCARIYAAAAYRQLAAGPT